MEKSYNSSMSYETTFWGGFRASYARYDRNFEPFKRTCRPLACVVEAIGAIFYSVIAIYAGCCAAATKEGQTEVNSSTGATGARFRLNGKKITHVVKSVQSGIMNSIRGMVGQLRLLSKQDPHTQTYNEYVGYQLSEMFGFHLVANTEFDSIKQESSMEFLEDFKAIKECKDTFCETRTFTTKEIEIWHKLSIFNFLLGNLDPNDENIFVKFDSAGNLIDAKMIDLGNSMPDSNPEWGPSGYLGDWGNYPIAQISFHETIKTFIRENITQAKINAFIKEIESHRPLYWTPGMINLLQKRFEVLQRVSWGKISSPYALSQIRTDNDYNRVLSV